MRQYSFAWVLRVSGKAGVEAVAAQQVLRVLHGVLQRYSLPVKLAGIVKKSIEEASCPYRAHRELVWGWHCGCKARSGFPRLRPLRQHIASCSLFGVHAWVRINEDNHKLH